MTPFTYHRAATASEAAQHAGAAGKYLGGGTNLVDLMRETIERPASLIDVTGLDSAIAEQPDGGLLIGAAARNTAVAEHRRELCAGEADDSSSAERSRVEAKAARAKEEAAERAEQERIDALAAKWLS